jgi:L-lysine exporter family protein LysE/ArgO
MMATMTQGFLLGLAYVMPIGAQNIYVINSASRAPSSRAALRMALAFAVMDVSLGIACIIGIGTAVQENSVIRFTIGAIGAIFLLYMGGVLLKKRSEDFDYKNTLLVGSLWKTAFLLTWCNPHALIDGSILLGGYQSSLTPSETYLFCIGLALSSTSWFISVTTIASKFRDLLTPKLLSTINRLCGLALITFSIKLTFCLIGDLQ